MTSVNDYTAQFETLRYTVSRVRGPGGKVLTLGQVVDLLNAHLAGAKESEATRDRMAQKLADCKASYRAAEDVLFQAGIRTGCLRGALQQIAACATWARAMQIAQRELEQDAKAESSPAPAAP